MYQIHIFIYNSCSGLPSMPIFDEICPEQSRNSAEWQLTIAPSVIFPSKFKLFSFIGIIMRTFIPFQSSRCPMPMPCMFLWQSQLFTELKLQNVFQDVINRNGYDQEHRNPGVAEFCFDTLRSIIISKSCIYVPRTDTFYIAKLFPCTSSHAVYIIKGFVHAWSVNIFNRVLSDKYLYTIMFF